MSSQHFCLDSPKAGASISNVTRVSGWDLGSVGPFGMGRELCILLDGLPSFALCRTLRPDLRAVFPGEPRALDAGFCGDVILNEKDARVIQLSLAERRQFNGTILDSVNLERAPDSWTPKKRLRSYELDDLVTWPGGGAQIGQMGCGRSNCTLHEEWEAYKLLGVPHFHPRGELPLIRLLESLSTHPYSRNARRTIFEATGPVLDLGAGIHVESELIDHVVYLDAVHFDHIDVVSTCPELPFRTDAFSAVVSQAVFEHVRDPARMASEVLRVLKPGGEFYVATAFSQPLHGDPSHFFNMTLPALHGILNEFEILESGVEPFQYPSYGIEMGIEAVLPYLSGPIKDRFKLVLDFVIDSRQQIDEALGEAGREILAAGVFAVARKPRR